jgi:hypothetical protein
MVCGMEKCERPLAFSPLIGLADKTQHFHLIKFSKAREKGGIIDRQNDT